MSVVVDANTVVYPRTVALDGVSNRSKPDLIYLLVMLGYTAVTPFAVLASQWLPNHTRNAKVLLVKLP